MSKEIKQNLFRFVTLRNPQLIEDKKEHPGFVYHPDEESSVFFAAIDGVPESEKQTRLREVANSFSAFKTRAEVRGLNESLYKFSSWLMRNKNNLSFKEIKDNLNGANSLNRDQEHDLKLWDNLICQTVNKQSIHVREAIIQMLIADQFLVAFNAFLSGTRGDVVFTKDQEKEFLRRANASVVISKALFDNTTREGVRAKKVSLAVEKHLEKTTMATLATLDLPLYKTLLEELKFVEMDHKKSTDASYAMALKAHNDEMKRLIDEAELVVITETNPETGVETRKERYPNLNLPTFNFSAPTPIDDSYLKSKLSEASYGLSIKDKLDKYGTFDEIRKAIKEQIKLKTKTILENASKVARKINVGGTVISSATPNQNAANYYISLLENDGISDVALSFNTLGDNDVPIAIECDATLTDGTFLKTSSLDVMSNNGSFIMIKLFENMAYSGNGTVRFKGTITFDSGIVYGFDVTMIVKRGRVAGIFSLEEPTDTTGNPNTGTDNPENGIFGVTSLGIADFRRVEQEVCCYVAGEVSHIENIMAREYKERNTRSLTSSESIFEESSESETEKLTDSSSTERNEMQSEIATVISEDQSSDQGASSNATYSPGNLSISAGGYANSASSSSTSNSNSQAQTYAQEVTERAMERIVQKVSKKRTSRILREFEENNTHGFDNRKGDEHITGVYRWIDKVYKNKLINYGKRLMYEFAIPEPAKFFKDALYKKAEANALDTAVILPTKPLHPSELGLHSAADLATVDYQIVAAAYNAEVVTLNSEMIQISKAFKLSFGDNKGQEGSSLNDGVEVPDGYEAIWFKLDGSMFHHGNLDDNSGQMRVAVGDQESNYYFQDSEVKILGSSLSNIRGEVAVSASTYDVMTASFNVYVKCHRTDEALMQWQDETFKAIMDAYDRKVDEYNAEAALSLNENGEKLKFNPSFNRSLEKKELKRVAIELLSKPKGHAVSLNNYDASVISKVNRNAAFDTHAATVKFFEQAFDWDIMSYTFYPYFYAEEASWKELFQEQDAADPLFQAFLQSGMARTIVPVRPGFEDAVNWYMSTGEIWNGQGLITDQDDDLFVSIAEEMQTVEGEVEGTWETRLPTSLTVIQAGSIGLNVEGLPCSISCDAHALFDSDGNPVLDENGDQVMDNPIKQTNVLIGGESITETTTSDPVDQDSDADPVDQDSGARDTSRA